MDPTLMGLIVGSIAGGVAVYYRLHLAVLRLCWRYAGDDIDSRDVDVADISHALARCEAVSLRSRYYFSDEEYRLPDVREIYQAVQFAGGQAVGIEGRDCDDAARAMLHLVRWDHSRWPVFYVRSEDGPHAALICLTTDGWRAIEPQTANVMDIDELEPITEVWG